MNSSDFFDDNIQYFPGFLCEQESTSLFLNLTKQIPFEQNHIFIFGRWRPEPRLSAWVGDAHCFYRYSGLDRTPLPWSDELLLLRRKIENFTQRRFNCVLINLYRNGADGMGWHSDDEPELGQGAEIASLSLGEKRRFRLRRKVDKYSMGMDLESGSLLWMKPGVQETWEHQVPKSIRNLGARLNLTFRYIAC